MDEQPVRILHVVVNMNRGGAETLIMNIYRNINRTKVQFDFLTCKPGVFDDEITEMGGLIHRIPYISDVGHNGYVSDLERFFTDHNDYRTVHSHMDKMSGLVLRAARKAGIPVRIAHSHNTRSEGNYAARLYKWYAGTYIVSSATEFFACSIDAAHWLFPRRLSRSQVLRNGIDSRQFVYDAAVRAGIRRELKLQDDTVVVGHVGRFVQQKNHKLLLELFADLQAEIPDSVLLLAGEGSLQGQLEQQATNLGIRNQVKFLGVRSDIPSLLQAFDVMVFPSLHEGLPLVLIEAQGTGLPCVVSDRVSNEVDMGLGIMERFSLQDRKDGVRKIVAASTMQNSRSIPDSALSENGFDIRNTVDWLQSYYISKTR